MISDSSAIAEHVELFGFTALRSVGIGTADAWQEFSLGPEFVTCVTVKVEGSGHGEELLAASVHTG